MVRLCQNMITTKIIQILEAIDEATENLRNEVRFSARRTETNVEGIVTFDKLFTNINTGDETTWLDPEVGVFTVQLDKVFRAGKKTSTTPSRSMLMVR